MDHILNEEFFLVKKEKGIRKNILCHMRLLSERETPLALALHEKIAQEIGDENIFCAVHTIEESIRGEGFVIGIFSGNRLVAMRAVSYEGKYMEEALADLRLPLAEKEHAAVMDFCITEKNFRGNYIQHFTFLKAEGILYPERYHLHCTISPLNVFSLRNVLRSGFHIVDLKEKYGGYLRFILHKNLKNVPCIYTHDHIEVPIEDYESHLALLSMGYCGYAVKGAHSGFSIMYGTKVAQHLPLHAVSGERPIFHLTQKGKPHRGKILPWDRYFPNKQ
ncbi:MULTISPECIES: hypothetical protein [Aminobacterium]|jgi:hypothetical protein|uniref:hypothetical protein n=1 Tax=Aminobacterium TaxID=81466 RepID=UPI00257AB8DF|nr:hypothetical protein [Aminobacterium sp. UBA4987]